MTPLVAELSSREKMTLFTDALAARDAGNYRVAREKLETLSSDSPGDPLVESTLREVYAAIEAAESGNGSALLNGSSDNAEIELLMKDELERQRTAITRAERALIESEMLIRGGNYDRALGILYSAQRSLPSNVKTKDIRNRLRRKKADALFSQSQILITSGQNQAAWESLTALAAVEGNTKRFLELKASFDRGHSVETPSNQSSSRNNQYENKTATYSDPTPDNEDADVFSSLGKTRGGEIRRDVRDEMINDVDHTWNRPVVAVSASTGVEEDFGPQAMLQKLNSIIIPSVSFSDMELSRVINSLNELSVRFDTSFSNNKGVNIVLIDPSRANPKINLGLRNLPLKRILDFVVDSVGYQYDVEPDAVVIRQGEGGPSSNMGTEFFPISRSTFIRMTGIGVGDNSGDQADDPFAPVSDSYSAGGIDEGAALRGFLQQAGVDFVGNNGSTLAYDGSSMIVTQTRRNLERIRNILKRYSEVRQVEIEAKFLEVAQGDLDEFGFQWSVGGRPDALGNYQSQFQTSNRGIADAFGSAISGSNVVIDGNIEAQYFPPQIPGKNAISSGGSPLGFINGSVGGYDVSVMLRALSQKSGSDLLSAPKIMVLSGDQAKITVAQEMRYPQAYSNIEPEVGTGSSVTSGGGGSAGVVIAAGTPQDFTMRNVGVELTVTPRVEEDNYSITLDLNPKVTEFDGFVEYGGPSVAISSGRTVTVPSGFYQPIFSVREINTRVTIWDGSTVVMGGLTREEVKVVSDKVPVLGSIPFLGKLFQSKGESTQKRNLLIFVTANLVSPGGSLKNQQLGNVSPGSTFQNPSKVTPEQREYRD